MITVPEIVGKIVKQSPFLEEALSLGIINLSSLARKILPQVRVETKKGVKLGAVIMALRRLKLTVNKGSDKIKNLIKNIGDLTVRSNLLEFTFANSDSLVEKQQELFHKIGKNNEIFYNFSRGVFETTIIVSSEMEKYLEEIFRGEKLISKFQNLSSITIKLPPENVTTPGIYYTILKYLAWENINVIEAFSTSNELSLFFRDNDIDRAFAVLKNIKRT